MIKIHGSPVESATLSLEQSDDYWTISTEVQVRGTLIIARHRMVKYPSNDELLEILNEHWRALIKCPRSLLE